MPEEFTEVIQVTNQNGDEGMVGEGLAELGGLTLDELRTRFRLRNIDLLVETGYAPSRRRGYQLVKEGRVPGVIRWGGTVRIVEEVFLKAIQERAVAGLASVRWLDSDAPASP